MQMEFADVNESNHLQKIASEISKEVLFFSFISVIQADLNKFMMLWNCRNMQKYFETPVRAPEVLLNLPAVAGFPKNGVIVTEKDIENAEEIVCIDRYLSHLQDTVLL